MGVRQVFGTDGRCVFRGEMATGVAWFEVDMPDVLRAKHRALTAAGASFSPDGSAAGKPLTTGIADLPWRLSLPLTPARLIMTRSSWRIAVTCLIMLTGCQHHACSRMLT